MSGKSHCLGFYCFLRWLISAMQKLWFFYHFSDFLATFLATLATFLVTFLATFLATFFSRLKLHIVGDC